MSKEYFMNLLLPELIVSSTSHINSLNSSMIKNLENEGVFDLQRLIDMTVKNYTQTGKLLESVATCLSKIRKPEERNHYMDEIETRLDSVLTRPDYRAFREFFRDERRRNTKLLTSMSYFDSLTGGIRKDFFETKLHSEILSAMRNKSKVSLVFIDIDYFKKVNDIYGHHMGDLVLQKLSDIIKKTLRSDDLFVRNGGEEFALILPGTGSSDAVDVIKRIQEKISLHIFNPKNGTHKPFRISISSGIVAFGDTVKTKPPKNRIQWNDYVKQVSTELVLLADLLLYEVKDNGRNGFALFNPFSSNSRDDREIYIETSRYKGFMNHLRSNPSFYDKVKNGFKMFSFGVGRKFT